MSICISARIRGGVVAAMFLVAAGCAERTPTRVTPESAASFSQSATLLACPTSQTLSTSSLISVLGGTVSTGGSSITIPFGALTVPTLITLTIPASQYMEIDARANDLLSFLFNQPVSVTIDYSRCTRSDLDSIPLSVWHIDPLTHELLENMGGVDNKANHTITFTTNHFSGYAVAF
jgi:hypothetical protein